MAALTDPRDADNVIATTPVHREIKDPEAGENRDPITDAPGSHPVGTGVGAAAAGVAGAVAGSVIPGLGTAIGGAVGAIVGAVAGGLAGKAVAEGISPTDEHAYWRDEYRRRAYYKAGYDYDADYGPAYASAIDAYNADPNRPFAAAEPTLQQAWTARRGDSRLDWDTAREPMRDVYERARRTVPASADDDRVARDGDRVARDDKA